MSPVITGIVDHQSIRSGGDSDAEGRAICDEPRSRRRSTARPSSVVRQPARRPARRPAGRSRLVPRRPRMCAGAYTFNCWINNRLESHHFNDKSKRRLGLGHRTLQYHSLLNRIACLSSHVLVVQLYHLPSSLSIILHHHQITTAITTTTTTTTITTLYTSLHYVLYFVVV